MGPPALMTPKGFKGSRVQGFKENFDWSYHLNPGTLESLNPDFGYSRNYQIPLSPFAKGERCYLTDCLP